MRGWDPRADKGNKDAFTVARKVYKTRHIRSHCLKNNLTLNRRLTSWMENLPVNMTSFQDWLSWQRFVVGFGATHVVTRVTLGVELQIFVACPVEKQTLWTSCYMMEKRGINATSLDCPQEEFYCSNAGFATQQVIPTGGDPVLGVALILAQYYTNWTAPYTLAQYLNTGGEAKEGAALAALQIDSLIPFPDLLRYQNFPALAEVMDEVIGPQGFMQCTTMLAANYTWKMVSEGPPGRWKWGCVLNPPSPTPSNNLGVPWPSVVIISSVSSALLVTAMFYLCRRCAAREKPAIMSQRTGNFYKDLAALTGEQQ